MPGPFTGPKMFCADPNFLSQPHNLTAFSAPSKTFVLVQKPILLNANHLFVWHKMFVTTMCTVCEEIFGLAQKIWTSPKHFGTCKRRRHKLCFEIRTSIFWKMLLFIHGIHITTYPDSYPSFCPSVIPNNA